MQASAPTAKRKLSVTDWIQNFERNIYWDEHGDPRIVMSSTVADNILSTYDTWHNHGDNEKNDVASIATTASSQSSDTTHTSNTINISKKKPTYRTYSLEFKKEIQKRLAHGDKQAAIARQYDIPEQTLSRWKKAIPS